MVSKLSYKIDHRHRQVRVVYLEQPQFEEWAQMMETILADGRYERGFGFIIDRRNLTRPASTPYMQQLVQFIEFHRLQSGNAKWALVVGDVASFGMARMAEGLDSSEKIRAFWEIEEARKWLAC